MVPFDPNISKGGLFPPVSNVGLFSSNPSLFDSLPLIGLPLSAMPFRRGHVKFRKSFSFQLPSLTILPGSKVDHLTGPLSAVSPGCNAGPRGFFGMPHREDMDIEKQPILKRVTEERDGSCSSSGSGNGDEEDWLSNGDNEIVRIATDVEERVRVDKGLFGWLGIHILTSIGSVSCGIQLTLFRGSYTGLLANLDERQALMSRASSCATSYLSRTLTLLMVLVFLMPFIRPQIPITRSHVVLCLGFTSLMVVPFLSVSLLQPAPPLSTSYESISELHSALLPVCIFILSPLSAIPRRAILSILAFSLGLLTVSPMFRIEKLSSHFAKAGVLGVAVVFTVVAAWWVLDLVTLSRKTGAAAEVWARQVLFAVVLTFSSALWVGEMKDVYVKTQSLGDLLGTGFLTELVVSLYFHVVATSVSWLTLIRPLSSPPSP